MKTVPTLCATATVVGASAVGLSFGRETPSQGPTPTSNPNSNSNKKKPVPARELHPRPMSAIVHSAAPPATAQSFSSPIPFSASRVPVATRYSHDGRPQRRIVRRMTSDNTSLQPPSPMFNGYTTPNHHEVDETDPLDLSSLSVRRPSWIKRLSNISNSQGSSRNSSPGPLSPAVSVSNGSMAFSHDGSTAPIIGKRPPSPLPPNKLVKRSSSVRVPREPPSHGQGSRLPSLRRPATSHQRSATLQQSALMEMAAEDLSSEPLPLPSKPDHDVHFTQYFTAKVSKDKTLSKKRNFSAEGQAFKRVFPDEGYKPTLVLAKAVSAGPDSDEVFESSSEDGGESVYLVSRPGTPLSITAVTSFRRDLPSAVENKTLPGRAPTEVSDDSAPPRRSFSITDLLSSGSGAKKQRTARPPGARLARKPSRRVSSAPLPAMGSRQTPTAHGDPAAPSPRRDITNSGLIQRSISTSARPPHTGGPRHEPRSHSSSSPSAALSPGLGVAMAENSPASMQQGIVGRSGLASTNQVPPSPPLAQTGARPSRHSVAPSEQASTLVGSDNEARGLGSGDEDDADLQSETLFDSLRTGATRSTSGARGPRIETIFDESPPSKVKVTALRDLLPKGMFREQAADSAPGQQSIAEEEESISTPVRTIVPERSINNSPSLSRGHGTPLFPNLIPSSPPDMPKPLSLGTLEWDSRAEDDGSSRWSVDEEDEEEPWDDLPNHPPATLTATPVSLGRHNLRLLASGSSPKPSTPHHLTIENPDRDARSSIFDWSEQQPADKSSGNRTPPRPSTVHGKKDADRRGSRSVGRRAPSGLHARSQSVPVVPDAAGKRTAVVTNKFGTWGVGSKGVTEDWNDDFDFSDLSEEPAAEGAAESHRIDSGAAMFVPKTIQEQQSNVLANIGLLREWGLLIEELKEQKVRAVTLGLLEGSNTAMWEEVDAMIDLADQEAEQDGIPRLSPPSSPGFDEDAFDDVSGSSPNHGRGRRNPGGLASDEHGNAGAHPATQPHRPRRRSILPPNHDIFGVQSSPVPSSSHFKAPIAAPDSKVVVTRPRKDSEAKARSVIEALQKRRSMHESVAEMQPPSPSKKVPFDTATLRRIVPYVSTLTRKVKDALREAEGLYSSPGTSPREPPFSRMFQTDDEISRRMKVMTVM